jgi:predicted aspartyl protease
MKQRSRHWHCVLVACITLVTVAVAVPTVAAQDADLPKPVRVLPAPMPALPAAVIDDTLAIGGEDIDAKKIRSRMTIAVEVNGTGPYRFVVDSGADSSVIGTRIARALQLPQGRPVTLNGMTGTSIVPRVRVNELSLGKEIVTDLELPVLAEHDLGGDGMLGIDALSEERLMLDFEKRLITVEDATKPPPRMDGEIVVTARRRRGQLILTEVKANGRTINAVIDTGSEITIGNSALREQIVRRGAKIERVEMTGVTGVAMELDLVHVGEIRLGSVILKNVPIAFADVPPFAVFGLADQPAMLLGTDLMETFRRVSLDFRARKVRFQLRKCESQGILISTSSTTSVSRLGVEKGTTEACRR